MLPNFYRYRGQLFFVHVWIWFHSSSMYVSRRVLRSTAKSKSTLANGNNHQLRKPMDAAVAAAIKIKTHSLAVSGACV